VEKGPGGDEFLDHELASGEQIVTAAPPDES
jgi:hypothetical protein